MFSDKIFFKKKMTPSIFDTDLCCRYVTSRGFNHVVAFIKCYILLRMQLIFYTNNTEAARNAQNLGGKHRLSSEILCPIVNSPIFLCDRIATCSRLSNECRATGWMNLRRVREYLFICQVMLARPILPTLPRYVYGSVI